MRVLIHFYFVIFIFGCVNLVLANENKKPSDDVKAVYYGYASWYGEPFHGRKTANGEIYDMHKMTAAHRSLPLGSYVRVINLNNGKQITVRVNDRGPYKADRIIDLSKKAASALNFLQEGLARVKVELIQLPEADGKTKLPPKQKVSKMEMSKTGNKTELPHLSNLELKKYEKKSVLPKKFVFMPAADDEGSHMLDYRKLRLNVQEIQSSVKSEESQERFWIQVGAYNNLIIALKQKQKFELFKLPVQIYLFPDKDLLFRLVLDKEYISYDEAMKARLKLDKYHIKAFILS